jgi:hypothetical protein
MLFILKKIDVQKKKGAMGNLVLVVLNLQKVKMSLFSKILK